eukprot:UN05886
MVESDVDLDKSKILEKVCETLKSLIAQDKIDIPNTSTDITDGNDESSSMSELYVLICLIEPLWKRSSKKTLTKSNSTYFQSWQYLVKLSQYKHSWVRCVVYRCFTLYLKLYDQEILTSDSNNFIHKEDIHTYGQLP